MTWSIQEGEALAWLASLPDASVDGIVTDPPYSSGGAFRGDRMAAPGAKYVGSDVKLKRPEFAGDNRDQRAYAYWSALWLSEALRVARPGAPIVVFTDWRQLPTTADALQAGGWIWRGIVPWHKPGARPQMGRFSAACEYALWGSNGGMDDGTAVGCLQGFVSVTVRQDDKFHTTGKPTALMREIVKIVPPGGVVCDPFAGSGTTLVAALVEGRSAIGCERVAEYAQFARERCAAAECSADWRAPPSQSALFGNEP